MILPARRGAPTARNYRTNNLRGLGFSYYDLLAQTDREDCDPRDSACVGRNQQQVNAVQELWNSQYLGKSDAQMGPVPKIDVVVDTSDRATNAFMNNQPVDAGIVFIQPVGGPTYLDTQLPPKPAAVVPVVPGAAKTTPGGQLIVTSAGAQTAPGTVADASTSKLGFDFSSIPMWGWAAAAAGAFFLFGGGKR